jgi:hypothetical protein
MVDSFGVCHAQFEAVGNMEQLAAPAVGHHPHDGAVGGPVVDAARVLEAAVPAEVDGVADLDVVPVGGAAGGPVLLQGHEDSWRSRGNAGVIQLTVESLVGSMVK